MKKIILLLLIITGSKCVAQPAALYSIQALVEYSKMRPMAMVKYLTTETDQPWQVDSDYYKPDFKSRYIVMSREGYKICTMFNDESDMLWCETPPNDEFYYRVIYDLKKRGFKGDGKFIDNIYNEVWDNSKVDLLNMTMISIQTNYDASNRVLSYSYKIVMHP